jgi:hypothetical protein
MYHTIFAICTVLPLSRTLLPTYSLILLSLHVYLSMSLSLTPPSSLSSPCSLLSPSHLLHPLPICLCLSLRACADAETARQASLRLVLCCKWRGLVLIQTDASSGTRGNYKAPSSRGVLGDLGNLLGSGWTDTWGTKGGDLGSTTGTSRVLGGNGAKVGAAWRQVYLVFQGSRLAWWGSESDIDEGKACDGQLLLYGHAGTTQVHYVILCYDMFVHVTFSLLYYTVVCNILYCIVFYCSV